MKYDRYNEIDKDQFYRKLNFIQIRYFMIFLYFWNFSQILNSKLKHVKKIEFSRDKILT